MPQIVFWYISHSSINHIPVLLASVVCLLGCRRDRVGRDGGGAGGKGARAAWVDRVVRERWPGQLARVRAPSLLQQVPGAPRNDDRRLCESSTASPWCSQGRRQAPLRVFYSKSLVLPGALRTSESQRRTSVNNATPRLQFVGNCSV